MGADLLQGGLDRPALAKIGQHLVGRQALVGREQGLGAKRPLGVSDQQPTQGHGWQAGMIPQGGLAIDFHRIRAGFIPVLYGQRLPSGGRIVEALLEGGLSSPFAAGAARGGGRARRRGIIQGGIQPQAGNPATWPRTASRKAKAEKLLSATTTIQRVGSQRTTTLSMVCPRCSASGVGADAGDSSLPMDRVHS